MNAKDLMKALKLVVRQELSRNSNSIREIVRVELKKNKSAVRKMIREELSPKTKEHKSLLEIVGDDELEDKVPQFDGKSKIAGILNETAKTSGGISRDQHAGPGRPILSDTDRSKLIAKMGYGEQGQSARDIGAMETIQAAGVSEGDVPEEVKAALTKDYRQMIKLMDKK